MQAATYIWAKVIGLLEQRLSAVAVSAMFDDAELIELNDKSLIIYSPSDFRQEAILRTYKTYVEEILRDEFDLTVSFEVWSDADVRKHKQEDLSEALWTYNPHFSFETFIPGAMNQIPLKASMHVAEHLGDSIYNPLFLYGAPGVGKTHLLYSIANRASRIYPEAKIVYVKGDQFTNELVQSIFHNTTAAFKQKYRGADILLVDDIQFIAGKESTQEEFFHTFNCLHEAGKQIVMTSDRAPADMATLEDRLRGRFGEGVMVKLHAPDRDSRIDIIASKASQLNLTLSEECIGYLADKLCDNVRQIEGALRKIKAFKDLSDMRLTLENIARTVEDVQTSETAAVITPDLVVRYVCRYYGVEESQLKGRQRSRNISEPRQGAIYLIRQMAGLSQDDIGRFFGRDRTTIIYAVDTIEKAKSIIGGDMEAKLQDIIRNIEANI